MVSPKWQTMWVESQHCSKSLLNLPLPSLQAKKILEDLKTSCCSPNKAVQLEALKCWGLWIHNQSPDEWKLNTVCFTAVRPLITKKLQPLHKDVEICKLKLSLMWALLVKVQDIMELEGPQYILEAFLQSCLTWLSSASDNNSDKEVSFIIFQLLLAVFDKSETLSGCDIENFPPLSSSILHLKKVFHLLTDKLLSIFTHWRKVADKSVFLKIWKHFLAHCESSHEHIPIPVWHKVFKLAGQVCSEKDEPVKERLAFLHSCATTLKSALSSSKFIDFGNLLTTPCEVLLKKLVELCSVECDEARDPQLFWHSKEICEALSDKSVAIGGYDLCIGVVDVLEEFCLRSLFWGVWCGLVCCCNALLKDTPRSHMTKVEMKFYRKLRGVAVNFDLDRKDLPEECITEVEKHIGFLSVRCLCSSHSTGISSREGISRVDTEAKEPMGVEGLGRVPAPQCDSIGDSIAKTAPELGVGQYSVVPFRGRKSLVAEKAKKLNFDLIKDVLQSLSLNCRKSLFGSVLSFRFISTRSADCGEMGNSIGLKVEVGRKEEISVTVCCREAKGSPPRLLCSPERRSGGAAKRSESEEVVSTPTTRSRKRAEEERRKEAEMQRRRKRKSFEILVQEIVRKNKERKTEKNSERKKTSDGVKGKRKKKKLMNEEKQKQKVSSARLRNGGGGGGKEVSERKLRNSKKEEPRKDQKKKAKNSAKADGKLENYFKVLTKKSENAPKKEVKPLKAEKKTKKANEKKCCESEKGKRHRRGEVGWKQTSLKAMMNPKSRLEKVKQGTRTREKTADVVQEKPKGRSGDRKVLSSSLAKMSPFKEVFHDHEYAKMKPRKAELIGKTAKKERRTRERKVEKETRKLDLERTARPLILGKAGRSEAKPVAVGQASKEKKTETGGGEDPAAVVPALPEERSALEKPETEEVEVSKPAAPEECKMEECKETEETEVQVIPVLEETTTVVENSEKPLSELNEEIIEIQATKTDACLDGYRGKALEKELTPERRSRKRVWMTESPRGSKRIKLEEEAGVDSLDEKLPLEVTEKENLEKNQQDWISPSKREKGGVVGRGNGSPRGAGGGMSRALRIIGLVPESTMGRSWDASPRVEVLKCKKAPNVDRNSRASKMLALLLENVVEAEDVMKVDEGEIGSSIVVATTPNAKTLLSSLKSPKSIKKRRSIRFDDARNETVLYQTDTPPSQILEEKEKRKGTGPFEVALDFPLKDY